MTDLKALIDAADLVGRFGDEAIAQADRLIRAAADRQTADEAIRWRNARHFLVKHIVIEQMIGRQHASRSHEAG